MYQVSGEEVQSTSRPRLGWMHAYHFRMAREAARLRNLWKDRTYDPVQPRLYKHYYTETIKHARLSGYFAHDELSR